MRILSVVGTTVFVGALAAYAVGAYKSGTVSLVPSLAAIGVPVPGAEGFVQPQPEAQTSDTAQPKKAEMTTGEGQGEIRRLVIGLDLSKSNPMVEDEEYAAKVAQRISGMIKELGFRSQVVVRTFGSFGGDSNTFRFDAVVSSRYRPEQLAKEINVLIANTPTLVERGTWQSQERTNILGFLENMAQVVNCGDMKTTYVLASDGIEESEYANLKRNASSLPAPTGQSFKGCSELLILGLGQGTDSPTATKRLRDEWSTWANAAGFETFSGLNDW